MKEEKIAMTRKLLFLLALLALTLGLTLPGCPDEVDDDSADDDCAQTDDDDTTVGDDDASDDDQTSDDDSAV